MTDQTKEAACELCGDQGPLVLHARCHFTAPLQVELDGDTLIVRCYLPDCRREVTRFTVARSEVTLPFDYQKMLLAYMHYIGRCEGTDFLPASPSELPDLSKTEVDELNRLGAVRIDKEPT